MQGRFSQDDLGKLVSLTVDVRNYDESCYQRDEDGILRVSYEAILAHKFLPRLNVVSDDKTVKVRGETLESIDAIKVAQALGTDHIKTRGEIVDIGEDYVRLKSVKRRRNYIY